MIEVMGVPTLTRFDLLGRMLESIDYPVKNLIIINNSGNQSLEVVKPPFVDKLWLLHMPSNLGVAGSWNMIIKSFPFAKSWLIASDDIEFPAGALERYSELVDSEAMQFFDTLPKWACFSVGEKVVEKAGLACELFHPAYFEDRDWERRIDDAGVRTEILPIFVGHDNSSTLKSGFEERNNDTFGVNQGTFLQRQNEQVASGGEWDLNLRRLNSWD